jgi:threonine aldolase
MSHAPRLVFTSDNVAAASPAIMAALAAANAGSVGSYGADPWTERLTARAREVFECELAILPVTTGTAANALALSVLCPPYGGVYCHEAAHIVTDECGAPEFYTGGAKLLGLPGAHGRITAEPLAAAVTLARSLGVHHVQPAAVSLSQATEWGAVYGLEAIESIASTAHSLGLPVHMDGARFANALVHLGCTPAEATWKRGVDVLSFGATKNGALAAEAVILFDPALIEVLALRRKRAGHLWSKQRFLSVQLLAYLEDELWLRNARAANALATRLANGLVALGCRLVAPVEANELFVAPPAGTIERLRARGYDFYDWVSPPGESGPVIRLVTAFDMAETDVDALLAAARGA